MKKYFILFLLLLNFLLTSCELQTAAQEITHDKNFKAYWYGGEAEISNYKLSQARYGAINNGFATLIYVTEPFEKDKQVKADRESAKNIPVLKLNAIKKFDTGIYPYSLMTSTFVNATIDKHAIKNTFTAQEWCGHSFSQLNNWDGQFKINGYSYFESEGDQQLTLKTGILEDELWLKIRLNPKILPIGSQEMMPAFAFLRLKHKPFKYYACNASLDQAGENYIYTLHYPNLKRKLRITFSKNAPYKILGWEETYKSGSGKSAKTLTSKATLLKTLQVDYWNKNKPKDSVWRKKLGF